MTKTKKKLQESVHWFHMILDEETTNELMAAGDVTKRKELCRFIVEVMEKFSWQIEGQHLFGPNQGCRYRTLPGEGERDDLWLPFFREVLSVFEVCAYP